MTKKRGTIFLILIILILSAVCSGQTKLVSVKPATRNTELYQPLFVDVVLDADYQNPFDPCDITLDAIIQTPEGEKIDHPCFYLSGKPSQSLWQLRFTPRKKGEYEYRFIVNKKDKTLHSKKYYLKVSSAQKNPGFLHVNPDSYYTFKFDNGTRFRGIGENIGWEKGQSKSRTWPSYQTMFKRLGKSGSNLALVGMYPWNLQIEWNDTGLCKYNLENCKRWDRVFKLARDNQLYLIWSFDCQVVTREEPDFWGANNFWVHNPYNAENGGPCKKPQDFFTNDSAKKLYKQRLRYIVARWAYSPYLLSWELWKEIEHIPASKEILTEWHKEMSNYLKKIDPYDHPISTSICTGGMKYKKLWDLPNIDYTMTHHYRSTIKYPDIIKTYEKTFKKPHIIGEFGWDWRGAADEENVDNFECEFHLGLWRGLFSPTPVLPLTWWWEQYHKWNSHKHFSAIAKYNNIMLNSEGYFQELKVNASDEKIQVLGVKTKNKYFIWANNITFDPPPPAMEGEDQVKKNPVPVKNAKISIPVNSKGQYKIKLYNTLEGKYFNKKKVKLSEKNSFDLKIILPELKGDIAITIEKERPHLDPTYTH